MLPSVEVENARVPKGVLDERGVLHCCHGLNYQTFDLRRDGHCLSNAQFRVTAAGPTLGAGAGGMVVATDHRMLFCDERSGIWLCHPNRPETPELLIRMKGIVGGLAVRDGQLLIVEASGLITALGDAE